MNNLDTQRLAYIESIDPDWRERFSTVDAAEVFYAADFLRWSDNQPLRPMPRVGHTISRGPFEPPEVLDVSWPADPDGDDRE